MISRIGKAALIAFVMVGGASVYAQAPTTGPAVSQWIDLRGIEVSEVSSPDFDYSVRGMTTTKDGRKSWLRVMAEFDTAPVWIDELTFTFYVVLSGNADDLPEGAKQNNLFSGTVTYVHIPEARRVVADVFLDPNTFARYGKPTYSAVVVTINGQPAAGEANPASSAKTEWWKKETPNEIPLLSRKETPFALIEQDRLPTIKP
jgi:hypothetical protein